MFTCMIARYHQMRRTASCLPDIHYRLVYKACLIPSTLRRLLYSPDRPWFAQMNQLQHGRLLVFRANRNHSKCSAFCVTIHCFAVIDRDEFTAVCWDEHSEKLALPKRELISHYVIISTCLSIIGRQCSVRTRWAAL